MAILNREIYEVNGKQTFFKVKANAFNIGKVLFAFVEFDTNNNKLKNNIDIYMPISDMLLFCNDVLSGKLPQQATNAAKENSNFPPPVFTVQGGTNAEKAGRADKKAQARVINFGASSRAGSFLFQALTGPGKVTEKGLISLENPTKPEVRINVPCSSDDLKKLCLSFKADYEAWLSGMYARREFNEEYKQNK